MMIGKIPQFKNYKWHLKTTAKKNLIQNGVKLYAVSELLLLLLINIYVLYQCL